MNYIINVNKYIQVIMEKIINILVERDHMDYEDARALAKETRDEIISNPDLADEIIEDYLGLEPDYLEDLLFNY